MRTLCQLIKMSATVDNGFLRVHEEIGDVEKSLRDPTNLFIIVSTNGEAYITKDTAFLLPLFSNNTGDTLTLSPEHGAISFLGWFVPRTIAPESISLYTDTVLRPGMHAIFTIRMGLGDLENIARTIDGNVTSSTGLTSLYTEPGIGALLQSVMLAKFLSNCLYCSICGQELSMRDSCCLARSCKQCVKEYFLPVQAYVCGVVFHGDKILLLSKHTDGTMWRLPLFELEVCETPMSALLINLSDATGVNIRQYMQSAAVLDLTISSVDISGLITIWQVCIGREFDSRDSKCAQWFTKGQCAELLESSGLTEKSVDGFLLKKWVDGTLNDHVANSHAPFNNTGM